MATTRRCLPASAWLLLPLLVAGVTPRAVTGATDLVWKAARSDMLRYERALVKVRGGEETLSDQAVVTVHGHDLRDAGQYMPITPCVSDLASLFGFRLPAAGQKKTTLKLDWKLRKTVNIRVRGEVRVEREEERVVHLRGSYKFQSRGKEAPGDSHELRAGTADVEIEFDKKDAAVQHARVHLRYRHRRLDAKRTNKGRSHDKVFQLTLQEIKRFRHPAFQAEVDAAIKSGLEHLRTLQEANGSFKPHAKERLGTTALAVLALLACDVPPTDESVEKAFNWMFRKEAKRTYEAALCLMAVHRAYLKATDLPPKRRQWVMQTAARLEAQAATPGSWSYPGSSARGSSGRAVITPPDSSNTQYAVLGLRAARHLGYEVQEKTWMGLIRHFGRCRERDAPKGSVSVVRKGEAVPDERYAHDIGRVPVPQRAGFRYRASNANQKAWGSMTCAGIASLIIARHELQRMQSKKLNAQVRADIETMILGAWAWLEGNWGVDRHPGHPGGRWYYYWLYTLERAGVLAAVKRVGGRDWYFEGALQLIARQGEKGDWNDKGKDETPQTCFGLLFLKRGTTPLDTPGGAGPVVTGAKK